MREVNVSIITDNIKEMCIEANHFLTDDMKNVFENAVKNEKSALGKQVLGQLEENLKIAGEDMIPICQDTGMAVVFINVGQDVHLTGGDITEWQTEHINSEYIPMMSRGFCLLKLSVVSEWYITIERIKKQRQTADPGCEAARKSV